MIFSPYIHPCPSISLVSTATWSLAVSTTMTATTNGESEFSNDDISVNTTHANITTITNLTNVSEYVLKFQFLPTNKKNDTDVAYTPYAILQTIRHHFPKISIYHNCVRTLDNFPCIRSYAAYHRHFNLCHVQENPLKNRPPMYPVFHRILSNVPLREIRKHYQIEVLLHKSNT